MELLRDCSNITYLNEKENEKKASSSLLPEDIQILSEIHENSNFTY